MNELVQCFIYSDKNINYVKFLLILLKRYRGKNPILYSLMIKILQLFCFALLLLKISAQLIHLEDYKFNATELSQRIVADPAGSYITINPGTPRKFGTYLGKAI